MKNNDYEDVWTMFDRLFDETIGSAMLGAAPTTRCDNLYHTPNFPPVNVFIDEETKDLTLEFALAGYKKEEVEISFEGDKMILELKPVSDLETRRILKKGFKTPASTTTFIIPSSKYKTGEVEAEMVDGVLTVIVRAVDEIKPKKVSIK